MTSTSGAREGARVCKRGRHWLGVPLAIVCFQRETRFISFHFSTCLTSGLCHVHFFVTRRGCRSFMRCVVCCAAWTWKLVEVCKKPDIAVCFRCVCVLVKDERSWKEVKNRTEVLGFRTYVLFIVYKVYCSSQQSPFGISSLSFITAKP